MPVRHPFDKCLVHKTISSKRRPQKFAQSSAWDWLHVGLT